jgi:hypothetical protein
MNQNGGAHMAAVEKTSVVEKTTVIPGEHEERVLDERKRAYLFNRIQVQLVNIRKIIDEAPANKGELDLRKLTVIVTELVDMVATVTRLAR